MSEWKENRGGYSKMSKPTNPRADRLTEIEGSVLANIDLLWRLLVPPKYLVGEPRERVMKLVGEGRDADKVIHWLQTNRTKPTLAAVRLFFQDWREEDSR
jgi:hypothetical protein